MDFILAKEMIEGNNRSILNTKSLLQSSLRKMTQTLEGNILHYKLSYMLVGILIILMVKFNSSILQIIFIEIALLIFK
jgi:hypothetical protein